MIALFSRNFDALAIGPLGGFEIASVFEYEGGLVISDTISWVPLQRFMEPFDRRRRVSQLFVLHSHREQQERIRRILRQHRFELLHPLGCLHELLSRTFVLGL